MSGRVWLQMCGLPLLHWGLLALESCQVSLEHIQNEELSQCLAPNKIG